MLNDMQLLFLIGYVIIVCVMYKKVFVGDIWGGLSEIDVKRLAYMLLCIGIYALMLCLFIICC